MGDRGVIHSGSMSETQLLDYARRNILLVQVGMNVIADQRRSYLSLPHMTAANAWNRSLGRALPTPLFVAVGPWPKDARTLAGVDERCLVLKMVGEPLLDAIKVDGQAALAEAAARRASIAAARLPDRTTLLTVDEAEGRKAARQMLWTIHQFAIKQLPLDRVVDPHVIASASHQGRAAMEYIDRDQMFDVMKPALFDEWRQPSQQITMFNVACGSMGWRNKLSVTPNIAAQLGRTYDFRGQPSKTIPGLKLDQRASRCLAPVPLRGGSPSPEGGRGWLAWIYREKC